MDAQVDWKRVSVVTLLFHTLLSFRRASRRARISYNYPVPRSIRSIWKIEIFRKLSPAVAPRSALLRFASPRLASPSRPVVLQLYGRKSGSIASYYRCRSEKCFFKSARNLSDRDLWAYQRAREKKRDAHFPLVRIPTKSPDLVGLHFWEINPFGKLTLSVTGSSTSKKFAVFLRSCEHLDPLWIFRCMKYRIGDKITGREKEREKDCRTLFINFVSEEQFKKSRMEIFILELPISRCVQRKLSPTRQ